MIKRKCGCVIADRYNTASVRNSYELGGYIKKRCKKHQEGWIKQINAKQSHP